MDGVARARAAVPRPSRRAADAAERDAAVVVQGPDPLARVPPEGVHLAVDGDGEDEVRQPEPSVIVLLVGLRVEVRDLGDGRRGVEANRADRLWKRMLGPVARAQVGGQGCRGACWALGCERGGLWCGVGARGDRGEERDEEEDERSCSRWRRGHGEGGSGVRPGESCSLA